MKKEKILQEVFNLIEKEGCYYDVMEVVTLGWSGYKGKIDEQLNALNCLADKLINKKMEQEMLKKEHTTGNLNLSVFPSFIEKILKEIAKK